MSKYFVMTTLIGFRYLYANIILCVNKIMKKHVLFVP